jgi:hypothetical protein
MANRENEERIFEVFRKEYGQDSEFIHYAGNEPGGEGRPDFIGEVSGETVGVEITEINIPKKIYPGGLEEHEVAKWRIVNPVYKTYGKTVRENEVTKQRIVDRACEKAEDAGLPPLRVSVYFTGNLPRGREASLTERLCEIVQRCCPEPGQEVELSEEDGLSNEFWMLAIRNLVGEHVEHHWDYIEAGGVETEFSSHLQEIIDTKSAKIPQYRQYCSMCWLIIAALGDRPSSFYQAGEQVRTARYESGFDKVFFLNLAFGSVVELSLEK